MATDWKIFKKFIKKQPLARFQNNFAEIVVGWPSYKFDIFVKISKKTWRPVGVACFSLYIYSKIFKNHLLWEFSMDFIINW